MGRASWGWQDDRSTGFALGPDATPYIAGEYFSASMGFGTLTTPGEPSFRASTYVARLQPNRLQVTGDSVVCAGGSLELTARTLASTVSYRWSTGATTARITVTQPGTYTVTASFPGGYSLSESFTVRRVTPTLSLTGESSPLCPGTPRLLTAVAPGAQGVRWSTGATTPQITVSQPGTYSVVATYRAGCTATAQITIAPTLLRINGRSQLCPGQSTPLTATAEGSPITAYQWSTGATTPTLVVGQAGTYTLTATLATGCQLTTTHTVGPPVAKVASVTGDSLLCRGTTLTLTALNPDALRYAWNTGETTPTIRVTQPGTYGVTLTYTGGCTSRDSLQIRAVPTLAGFTLGADTTLCLEQPLLLQAPALNSPGVTRRWSDGSSGPTLLVQEAGTYSLQLTSACESRTITRSVAYRRCVAIPNVITPNEDQRNDRFVIQGLTSGPWALTLYNRWGRQIYHTTTYQQDWGTEAGAGVYYYVLRQERTNSLYKGWLQVIR